MGDAVSHHYTKENGRLSRRRNLWHSLGEMNVITSDSVLTVEADRRVHIDLLLYRFLNIAAVDSEPRRGLALTVTGTNAHV